MNARHLETVAGSVIAQVMRRLPDAIRQAAQSCVIEIAFMHECQAAGEGLEADLLGLFEGRSHADADSECVMDLPRIRLFLDNLWDYAGRERALFRDEVRQIGRAHV